MILSRISYAVAMVLLASTLLVGCESNRTEPPPVAEAEPAIEPLVGQGTVAVQGTPQNPRYDVTFDAANVAIFRGKARIERQEAAPNFEMRIRGRSAPHQWVTLNADGFGPIFIFNEASEKRDDFYDELSTTNAASTSTTRSKTRSESKPKERRRA
jgi:hypothetical protein